MKKETKDKFSSYQIIIIIILALTQFTVVLDFMVMSPLGDILMKSMSMSTKQFGITVSAYAFSAGISGFIAAGFADKFDRKKILLFFYIGFIIGTFFCAISSNYIQLLLSRIVTGLFGGVIGSISLAILTDIFPIEKRGRAISYVQMAFGTSQILGIPISLFLANEFGWQSPFMLIVVLSIFICIIIMLKMKSLIEHLKNKNEKNPFLHLIQIIKKKNYRIGFLCTTLISVGGFLMMPWGSAYSINNLKVTEHQLPLVFMVAGCGSLIFMPIIGRLSDKIDKLKIFIFAVFWLSIVGIIYTNLSDIPLWLVMILYLFMMFGITSRMVPSMALITFLPEQKDRGAFMSISSSLQQISGGLAAAIGGLIVVQKTKTSPLEHYNIISYIMAVISFISIFILYRVNKIVNSKKSK